MIAVVEAARVGLFRRRHWLPNVVAGLTVGVVALPLAMAFAIASGAKPEQGIYTAIIASVAVSLFGGTRIQIAGPTGAFIVILAGVTAQYGIDGLMLATLMAGAILILLGIARFGGVIRFIPDPVIVGFTAGIAVIIWVGQWRDFFGLPGVGGIHFHQKLWLLLQALPHWHAATTGLAALGLLLVIATPRVPGLRRIPGPLIAMLVVSTLQLLFHFDGVATIGSAFGGVPRGLPTLSLPLPSFERIMSLLPAAFTIAMLGAIESLLSAVVADGMAGTRHNANQELIGQGIANLLSPLFGGFAATGAIARTATNYRNGANSPLAGIVHALTLILILLALAPLANHIPLCALAAILFVVAWNMSDARHFWRMLRTAPRADMVILLITFVLTVFTDLVVAVNIGVILAMLQLMRRMASSVAIVTVDEQQLRAELQAAGMAALPSTIAVHSIEGPLFFGAVESLDQVLQQTSVQTHCIVIRLNHVPFMDITGLQALNEAMKTLAQRGVRVLLCEANPRVLGKLVRAEVVARDKQPPLYYAELSRALAAAGEGTSHQPVLGP